MRIFFISYQDIARTRGLILSTRITRYLLQAGLKNLAPLDHFLLKANSFSIGKIKREKYEEKGEFPIVDQSKEFIVGYSDEADLVYSGKLPIIVFGDHTRVFKYVDFPFIQGADGIQIIAPDPEAVNPKFFYYLLNYIGVPSRDYNRHFSILKKQKYPIISKTIQDETIAKIEPVEREIQKLQETIGDPAEAINRVFAREFDFDLVKFEKLKEQKIFFATFSDIARHKDLRCGIGVVKGGINLRKYVRKHFDYVKLGEILSLEYGNALPEAKRVEGEYPVVGANGIVGFHEEYLIKAPSVIVGRKGSAGAVNYIEMDCYPIDTTFYVKLKDDSMDLLYLSYLLKFVQLPRLTLFKGVPGLNRYDVYDIEVPKIDSVDQKKIVEEVQSELSAQDVINRQIQAKREEIDKIIEQALS